MKGRVGQVGSVRSCAAICVMAIAVVASAFGDHRVRTGVTGMRVCLATVAEPFSVKALPEPAPPAHAWARLMPMSVVRPPETVADVSGLLSCPRAEPVTGEGAARVGIAVDQPRKTKHVSPVYPLAALAAGRHGLVILEAVIARDGSVGRVRVLRSVAMLDQVAIEAVRQWRYAPMFHNRQPIEVVKAA